MILSRIFHLLATLKLEKS
ncbi:hypothetical protein Pint_10436 [Pistacia integerrima]|uniref:Uncharacterized protein n=1 Tax=Pistacia integerrima TaxID=434235 RepID=A0ACC0XI91_9ROSI|nr:hypothetical protein Pint_10436 [Pistacia integerrima]